MENLEKIKCLVCDIDLTATSNTICLQKLTKHITRYHNLSQKEYYDRYILDGDVPKCSCGCGNETRIKKWKYDKYYKDHKNKIKSDDDVIYKIKKGLEKNNNLSNRLNRLKYNIDDFIYWYDCFINMKYNLTELEQISSIDKRTIKRYWEELKIIDLEEYKRTSKKHKGSTKKRADIIKKKVDGDILFQIYEFIKINNQKFTLNELIDKFDIKYSKNVVYKRLKDNFSDVDEYLKYGNSSNPEIEFYNVIRYFFGKNANKQFKLENKVYDIILYNKILIEFDGTYWHSLAKNVENDKLKDEIARRNNYIMFRVKDTESNSIEILNKLKKIIDKYVKI